jgi:uracil-DNA glycosylase
MIDRKSFLKLPDDWFHVMSEEYESKYFIDLRKQLLNEYSTKEIRPDLKDVFNAFKFCTFEKLKVVILGQDPYHNVDQAHGLAFSVSKNISIPPSLVNIFKELTDDIGIKTPVSGCLEKWATQGILLLNAFLTVELHKPLSHSNIGWEQFTDSIISKISDLKENIVFIFWGSFAKEKRFLVDQHKHCVLLANHPSPMSSSKFFGCKHFSKTNSYLLSKNIPQIDWSLT